MIPTIAFPDTRSALPPPDHHFGAALWLLGRHPQLVELAERVPGVVGVDADGAWYDPDELVGAIRLFDRYTEPSSARPDDRTLDELAEKGLTPYAHGARALGFMSGTERGRLRLLATLCGPGIRFGAFMLDGFDEAGQAMIADWCLAVRA